MHACVVVVTYASCEFIPACSFCTMITQLALWPFISTVEPYRETRLGYHSINALFEQACLTDQPTRWQVLSDVLFLAADFCVCTFSHVKRAGNSVAHFLARQCKSRDELQVWFESILEDIAPLVARDAL